MMCNNWSTAVAQAWLVIFCFCAVFRGGSCCLQGWFMFRDHCFQFNSDKSPEFLAALICHFSDAQLASISDEDVLQYIARLSVNVPGDRFWVGLQRKEVDSPLQWDDGTSADNQSWVLPGSLEESLKGCYVYNGANVKSAPCTERFGFICSYKSSKISTGWLQKPCNPAVYHWTKETFVGDTTGKCVFRAPGLTTKEKAKEKCFEYQGDFLDLDGILLDSMKVMHQTNDESSQYGRMTNDGFRYWTDLKWNGTNIIWNTGSAFREELHLPIIQDSGSCVTVEFNFTDTLQIHLYQTDCDAMAFVFCKESSINTTFGPRTTTERPFTDRTTIERSLNDSPNTLECPDGYNWKADSSSNYCYWETSYETERLSWYDAEKYCQSFGGHLASLHSVEEEKIGLSFQYNSLPHPYWIGLQLDTDTETYKWIDGSPLDYNNWGPGHPDHRDKRLRCVSMEAKEAYWTSSLCGILSWFICKAPKQLHPAVPVLPTSTPLKSCDAPGDDSSNKLFYYDGACYFLTAEAVSWHRAKQFCDDVGATLASIHSDEEIGFLLKLLDQSVHESDRIWIGLNALGVDGSFRWTDWSPVDFTFFNKSVTEQDEQGFQSQDKCCNMDSRNGFWNGENCNAPLSFICKRSNDTSSTTIPPSTPDPRIGNCKKGWITHHDRCYYVGGQRKNDRVNWTQAVKLCNDLGGYLTSIRNENEQAFLAYLLQSLRLDAWIGLHDTIQSGRYYWLDNSDLQYTKWAIGEPSFFGIQEDCVKMVYDYQDSGVWKDDECDKTYGYICQNKKDPSLPAPDYERGINCLQTEGWLKLDTMCFKMFAGNNLTWAEAESSCKRDGGHLVSVTDKSVKAAVSYLGTEVKKSFWIGLRYKESSQRMYWLNDWPMALSNWEKNEPGLMKEDTCFVSTSEGYWKKTSCDDEMSYLCQITTGKPTKLKMYTGNCSESSKQWISGSGSYCYILDKDHPSDWFAANRKCHKFGADLTSIHSMSEIEDIKKLMVPGVKSVFIGLSRKPKGGFTWTDDSPVDFVNWDEEPDNSSSNQCVEMMTNTMKWRSASCEAKKYLICKDDKDTVFYGDPESEKRTDGSSSSLSSTALTAIIVSVIIVLVVIVAAGLHYSKNVWARNRLRNQFRPHSSVSFENALYNVDSSSMEFHNEQKLSL